MLNNKKSLIMKRQHKRALKHYKHGHMQEASEILENLLKRRDDSEWWNDWASVQLARGKSSDAERGYRKAILLQPENQVARLNLGIYLALAVLMASASVLEPKVKTDIFNLRSDRQPKSI